jgi:hypothetical protein
MPEWLCVAGSSLLIPSGTDGSHLFIILNDPCDFDGYPTQSCVSVCTCTIRSGPYDDTCVLQAGSHPFLNANSFVAYRHARMDQATHLQNGVASGIFVPRPSLDDRLLNAVRDGLYRSPQTPRYLKRLVLR